MCLEAASLSTYCATFGLNCPIFSEHLSLHATASSVKKWRVAKVMQEPPPLSCVYLKSFAVFLLQSCPLYAIVPLTRALEADHRALYISSLSFLDDIGWVVKWKKCTHFVQRLEHYACGSQAWGKDNTVQFETAKTEEILYSKRRYHQWKKVKKKMMVDENCEMKFQTGATNLLRVQMDSWLRFQRHHEVRMAPANSDNGRLGLVTLNTT